MNDDNNDNNTLRFSGHPSDLLTYLLKLPEKTPKHKYTKQ